MISVFIDYKLERYKREIKYTFDFIFHTLGYSHRYVSSPEKLKDNDILFIYGLAEPELEELIPIAKQYITLFVQANTNLYDHRAMTPDKLRRQLREIKLLSATPVISERKFDVPAENYSEADINAGKINFDLVGNLFFHLADLEPLIDNHRDLHGFFPEDASAFYTWKDTPFIDNLLWLVDSMIKEHTRSKKQYIVQKHYWPEGQQAAVTLTHTVDDLQKWDFNSLILSVIDDMVMFATLKWQQLYRNIWSKTKYLFTNYEMYWNFDEYRNIEREYNCKSTYFIAAEQSPDLDYSLDDPDLQEEIASILREGHEIGLLTTDDKLNRDDFVTRKQIMLHQIHKEQIGIRQYGYHVNEALRDLHLKLAPAYDNSSAFQDCQGFKGGFSVPYYPWITAIKANFVALPTQFRDRFLRVNKHSFLQLDDAKHQFKKIFQNTLRTRGVFCCDFSLAGYSEIPFCNKLYEYILALIQTNKVWQTNGSEIAAWWDKRSRITIEESEYEISVYFPDAVDNFVLQIFNDFKIAEIVGNSGKIDGNSIAFSNVKADTYAMIRLQQNT
ncbi:MAG: hypothetical protein CVU48_02650 [Candidatus Cloacimonetes bacterium HGW-Cloacimonetes-1]|jgi:hypothetical protein|nr:MAG: hypothetical protein CVU48_02650 [Candidatus Cloacimonetes bacterium HGW-Cloacimonetes-1]